MHNMNDSSSMLRETLKAADMIVNCSHCMTVSTQKRKDNQDRYHRCYRQFVAMSTLVAQVTGCT
jgi:hypothetical protein